MPIIGTPNPGAENTRASTNSGAVALMRASPGQVALALPGQGSISPPPAVAPPESPKPRIVRIHIFDDMRKVYVVLARALYKMGMEWNSMFARTPGEELWFQPIDAAGWTEHGDSKVDRMVKYIEFADKNSIEFGIFDIRLEEPGKLNGYDLLAMVRQDNPKAFLASHSSYIQNMSEQSAFRAADVGIMKETDEMLRAAYLYSRLFFGTWPSLPNPNWVQDCSVCMFYVPPQTGSMPVAGACTRIQATDAKLAFLPGTLCPWLSTPTLLAAYQALVQQSTEQTPFDLVGLVKVQIQKYMEYVRDKSVSQSIRRQMEEHDATRDVGPTITVMGSDGKRKYVFHPRDPMVINPKTFIAPSPSVLEGIGIPRARTKGIVLPPGELYQHSLDIEVEYKTLR